jgi:ABC-2 type transport system permease protein
MILMVTILIGMEIDTTPLGYVDHSGVLKDPIPAPTPATFSFQVPMIPFQNEDDARQALESGELQAYYVLEESFTQTGGAKVVYVDEPESLTRAQFNDYLAANLLADQPPEVIERVTLGSNVIVSTIDESRQMHEEDWFNILIPIFMGVAFIVAIFSTSGYLMQAVAEEKENQTMEIVVTSVSPGQLMGGKIFGDIAIGLTQILAWFLFIFSLLMVVQNRVQWLQTISISLDTIALNLMIMIPAFFMFAALMAAIGATVTEASEGQQVVGLISLPVWIPFMLIVSIMQNPNSPMAIGLSFFPLTAPLTMVLRAGFTVIPTWQVIISVSAVIISALGALWLAGRAFRIGMLRYGQRVRWREVFSRILHSSSPHWGFPLSPH